MTKGALSISHVPYTKPVTRSVAWFLSSLDYVLHTAGETTPLGRDSIHSKGSEYETLACKVFKPLLAAIRDV